MTAIVYRLYDADDRLIYIGATGDWKVRQMTHHRATWWWDLVARMSYQEYPTRAAAADAEAVAIQEEQPAFNWQHTPRRCRDRARPHRLGGVGALPGCCCLHLRTPGGDPCPWSPSVPDNNSAPPASPPRNKRTAPQPKGTGAMRIFLAVAFAWTSLSAALAVVFGRMIRTADAMRCQPDPELPVDDWSPVMVDAAFTAIVRDYVQEIDK